MSRAPFFFFIFILLASFCSAASIDSGTVFAPGINVTITLNKTVAFTELVVKDTSIYFDTLTDRSNGLTLDLNITYINRSYTDMRVFSAPLSISPVYNVALDTTSTILNYSGTDPEGNVLTYHLFNSTDDVTYDVLNDTTVDFQNFSDYPAGSNYWRTQFESIQGFSQTETSLFFFGSNVTLNQVLASNARIFFRSDFIVNVTKFFVILYDTNRSGLSELNYEDFPDDDSNTNLTVDIERSIRTRAAEQRKGTGDDRRRR